MFANNVKYYFTFGLVIFLGKISQLGNKFKNLPSSKVGLSKIQNLEHKYGITKA
jgi:hypothetical protein